MIKIVFLLVLATAAVMLYCRWAERSRREFLEAYCVPDAVLARFGGKHPQLSADQRALVQEGLRQYFRICLRARRRFVSMPSQVADDLWHEFILFTRNYQQFCSKGFGRYLHHTPVEAMNAPTQASAGIRRTWYHACRMEGINPRKPDRLPLLFALDAQLGIANGFFYTLNCENTATSSSNTFCASDIGCGGGGSSCGGDAGGHGCGSSCGGGCGGGGD